MPVAECGICGQVHFLNGPCPRNVTKRKTEQSNVTIEPSEVVVCQGCLLLQDEIRGLRGIIASLKRSNADRQKAYRERHRDRWVGHRDGQTLNVGYPNTAAHQNKKRNRARQKEGGRNERAE